MVAVKVQREQRKTQLVYAVTISLDRIVDYVEQAKQDYDNGHKQICPSMGWRQIFPVGKARHEYIDHKQRIGNEKCVELKA